MKSMTQVDYILSYFQLVKVAIGFSVSQHPLDLIEQLQLFVHRGELRLFPVNFRLWSLKMRLCFDAFGEFVSVVFFKKFLLKI